MKRRAILFAAASKKSPLHDANADLEMFHSFLRSNLGGAWTDDEVVLRTNPRRDQIISAVQGAGKLDYCLVLFLGSGKKVKNELPWLEMEMSLNSGEIIGERELNSGSPRCTLILDCCHGELEGNFEPLSVVPPTLRGHDKESSELRSLYERSLTEAESGLVRVYVTTPDNATVASTHSFTQYLVSESFNWAMQKTGVLHLREATALASTAMSGTGSSQQIEYLGGRRLHHFPFAIQHEPH